MRPSRFQPNKKGADVWFAGATVGPVADMFGTFFAESGFVLASGSGQLGSYEIRAKAFRLNRQKYNIAVTQRGVEPVHVALASALGGLSNGTSFTVERRNRGLLINNLKAFLDRQSDQATVRPGTNALALALLSPDRSQVWNGQAWVGAVFSPPDGALVWDGITWRPAPSAYQAQATPEPPRVVVFAFLVGRQEIHRVRVGLNHGTAQLTVDVDGEYLVNQRLEFSMSVGEPHRLTVGTQETHAVVISPKIEVSMHSMPYTFRIASIQAFVDEQFVGTYEDDAWVPARQEGLAISV